MKPNKNQRKKYADYYQKYEKDLSAQIDKLPDLTGCSDKSLAEQEKCVKQSLGQLAEDDALKIEEVLELKTHNLIKSKKKKNIVNFLTKKFEERLHGKKSKNLSRKDKKYIDDRHYFTIYKNQLANNVLLEIATFCRERVTVPTSCVDGSGTCSSISIGTKSQRELDQLQHELSQAVANSTKPLAVLKNDYCMQNLRRFCIEERVNNYHEACLLKNRLSKAEKAIEYTRNIEKGFDKHYAHTGHDMARSKAYSGILNGQEIEEVSAITSDLAHNEKEEEEVEQFKQEFEQECRNGDTKSQECKQYFNVLTQNDLDDIEKKIKQKEIITRLKLDYIQKEDEEKLKKIASEYIDTDNKKADQIRRELDEELRKKRESIIASIKNKIVDNRNEESEEDIDVASNVNQEEKKAQAKANALRDNIFYSNLVNSYLERSSGQGKNKVTSDNAIFREREFAAAEKVGGTYAQNVEKVKNFIESNSPKQQGRSVASQDRVEGTIDGIKALFDIVVRGKPQNNQNSNTP